MVNILPATASNGDVVEVIKSYISILNNNQNSLEIKGGNIDISYKSNEYIFSLEQLKFTGKVAATEKTSEIDAEFTLNGSLKLSGKDNYSNADIYKNLTADFNVDTIYKSNNKLSNLSVVKKKIIYKKQSTYMNSGFYLLNKKFKKYLKKNFFSLENDIIEKLIDKKIVDGIKVKGNHIDIGTKKNLNFFKKYSRKINL